MTPWSMTLQCQRHCRVFCIGKNISAKSKPYARIPQHGKRGPDGSESWTNWGKKPPKTVPFKQIKLNKSFFYCFKEAALPEDMFLHLGEILW